jgi:type II pantothenate kinase
MSHFCLLADHAGYAVSDVDLLADAQQRDYWLKLFQEHFAKVLESARLSYGRTCGRQVELARKQFAAVIAGLRADPAGFAAGPLGVVQLCRLREKALRDNALHDPFRHVKSRENRQATAAYPQVIRRLSAVAAEQRWERLIRGVFAGNIFDLGATATLEFADRTVDFEQVLAQVKPRPWLIDDFDALAEVLPLAGDEPAPWAKAVVLVDNAGADFVLGVLPLARQLASHGTHVVLAANELPSLNDITADETAELVELLSAEDEQLAAYLNAGLFEVVSTGNDIPLIDLSNVSDELNQAAAGADLVVLEGMGRSVESNYHTQFAVDSLQVCLLKDPAVAARVKGQVFDCVCLYRPVEPEPPAAQA